MLVDIVNQNADDILGIELFRWGFYLVYLAYEFIVLISAEKSQRNRLDSNMQFMGKIRHYVLRHWI